MNQQWLASVDMSLAFAVSPVAACLLLLVLGICSTSTENTTEVSGSGSATGELQPGGQRDSDSEREVIHLLTLLPYFNPIPALNPSWQGGDDIQPALELAKDQINNHSSILRNYTLELVHNRTGCDVITETPLGFIKGVFSPPRTAFAGLIGPGCSTSTILLGPITRQPNFSLVMLHGAGGLVLANRTKYPYLVGTLGSTKGFATAYLELVRKFQWNRIGILYDNARLYYTSTKRYLVEELAARSPSITPEALKAVSFTYLPLDLVRDRLVRVVFVMCPLELTQRIMCLAHNSGMVYPNYQFVIMSHDVDDIIEPVSFSYEGTRYSCSGEEMASTLETMLLLNYNFLPTEGEALLPDITYEEFLASYSEYRGMYNQKDGLLRNSSFSVFAAIYYDSVWAWALVLDNLTKSDPSFRPSSHYGRDRANQIVQQFYSISFQGMSGAVSYQSSSGFTPRRTDILQISKSNASTIAYIDIHGDLVLMSNSDKVFISDSFQNRTLRVNHGGSVFFTIISGIQLCLVVTLQVITVAYNKRPSIKASSPKLLHLSYIGIYVLLIGILVYGLHSTARLPPDIRPAFCQLLWTWCLPIGFTLIFVPVAMRTWRIYRIFKHYMNPGPFISDPVLIGAVVLVLAVDLVLAVAWTVTAPFFIRKEMFVVRNETKDINMLGIRHDCTCNNLGAWTGVIVSYKLLILFIFAAFAVLTRRISNRSFATASLRVLVYLLAIILPLGFSLFYVVVYLGLDGQMGNFSFFIISIEFNVVSIVTIVCVFIPPLLLILNTKSHSLTRPMLTSSMLTSSGNSRTKFIDSL